MKKPQFLIKILLSSLLFVALYFGEVPNIWQNISVFSPVQPAYATVSITTATGGNSISADTTGGSYTTLTGPTITEGSSRDIASSGTIILSAPSRFVFNTGANVTATITRDGGNGTCF